MLTIAPLFGTTSKIKQSTLLLADPMDCTDMVVMSARGRNSRIQDAYTRDRSTPKPDGHVGGTEDLTAAVGEEENGWTTVLFRKKLAGYFYELV